MASGTIEQGGGQEFQPSWVPEWNLSEDLMEQVNELRAKDDVCAAVLKPLPLRYMNGAIEIE